jgi:hypothetical protein
LALLSLLTLHFEEDDAAVFDGKDVGDAPWSVLRKSAELAIASRVDEGRGDVVLPIKEDVPQSEIVADRRLYRASGVRFI